MLSGSTLRFTAKTRKQWQQPPWHRDCYMMQVSAWSQVCYA